MSDIKILGKNLSDQEVAALKELAAEAGCDHSAINVVDSIGDCETNSEDAVVLILANPSTCSQPDLEQQMARVAASGSLRAIWVWPKDATSSDAPEAIQKYCYDTVSWDAVKLARSLADDDVTCLELPSGMPLPLPKMEHNKCIDEPKTQKEPKKPKEPKKEPKKPKKTS